VHCLVDRRMSFGLEALRRFRAQQDGHTSNPDREQSLLAQVPPDAPMDDATIAVWNGQRFVAYDKWLVTAPIVREENPNSEAATALHTGVSCVVGDCPGTRVWLVRDGERWLMYAGSRKSGSRRRDFASPFLSHAIRTADQWYGVADSGWRTETGGGKEAER
jgi:hypothetical protein